MKYSEEMYIDSGIYGDSEEGVKNRKERLVKCRNIHMCSNCGKEIEKGEYAVCETGFLEGENVSCYTCLECIEEWLEESGQVDNED